MRLLLLNPNTTVAVTETMAEVARSVCAPGTEVIAMTAPHGPDYIRTPEQEAVAGQVVRQALVEHENEYDAAIIAAFLDPGLAASRAAVDRPVIGIAEAALLTARVIGERIAIVTAAENLVPLMREQFTAYGLMDRVVALRSCSDELLGKGGSSLDDLLGDLAAQAIEEDAADVIVLGGGPLAGLRARLHERLGVPVVDGVICAARLAETTVALTRQQYE